MKQTILDFSGTHSSGKTCVINSVEKILILLGYSVNVIKSASREHIESHNLKLYGETSENQQSFISLVNFGNILDSKADFVLCTDLGVRSLAYTLSLKNRPRILTDATKQFVDFFASELFQKVRNTFFFYLPIEFPMITDGVRRVDDSFREEVDKNVKYVLTTCHVPFTTLTGTIEARAKQVLKTIL